MINTDNSSISRTLASELAITQQQVKAFITLYDDGNTVPFIARYRKQATSGLDDLQLRTLETRLLYLRELYARRSVILKSLTEQNRLTELLQTQLLSCRNKAALELLYAPFKSKRISKGKLAIDAGLEALADRLWFKNETDKEQLAKCYINRPKGFADVNSVLDGAVAIVTERLCSDAGLLEKLRKHLLKQGHFVCKVVKGKEQSAAKFKDYFDYCERVNKIAPHRFLAILRGKKEGFLRLKLEADFDRNKSVTTSYCQTIIAKHLGFSLNRQPADSWRAEAIEKAWKSRLSGMLETQLISSLKEKAHNDAIEVFAGNLKDLLMAAPAGRKVILGLDPGFRSGCKIAVIDETGKLLDYATIYPHQPVAKYSQAQTSLLHLLNNYNVSLIAIGNGTASRETDSFVRDCLSKQSLIVPQLIVSEAGASVYSASELASVEFPELDVAIRGAVSIARRLQDPLAELVKIDAKAIGVGLYQHDLNQTQLSQRLQAVVEDCVNAVGVDLNTASVSLLSFIAGLNKTIAQNIVSYRDVNGVFKSRQALKKVPRLGDKAFQQCAGFLRIANADNPLDNSAVHPETYPLVNKISKQQNKAVSELINNVELLNTVNIEQVADQQFGVLTVKELVNELAKPTRDPRPTFQTVRFAKGINKIDNLNIGLVLQGVISNVTSFGAFVDIGVHQDGLVHISQLADKFVSDPLQVVKVGQIVQVKVQDVDYQRKRIALTMRL
jgi:uncharacterized protein